LHRERDGQPHTLGQDVGIERIQDLIVEGKTAQEIRENGSVVYMTQKKNGLKVGLINLVNIILKDAAGIRASLQRFPQIGLEEIEVAENCINLFFLKILPHLERVAKVLPCHFWILHVMHSIPARWPEQYPSFRIHSG
jgi:hypothetical protein